MLSSQSPAVGNQKLRQKTSRKPLQPKNFQANPIDDQVRSKPKPKWIEISLVGDSNKENHPNTTAPTKIGSFDASLAEEPITTTPTKIESFDASLADELSAIRKKLERLRLEKEKTEKMLRERDLVLEMQMQELQRRGEAQKKLEIMVEKLQRLNNLRSSCMKITPMQSLREKEREKQLKEAQLQEVKSQENECVREQKESMDKISEGTDRNSAVEVTEKQSDL